MGQPIRLQKILASAGFGSRRACEVFITEGRVSVDGVVVNELGARADVESQSVELDGRKIAGPGKMSKAMRDAEEKIYYALNKPKGTLCTTSDPSGRPVAVQLVPETRRIFCVGRLDIDTEGLILLTNDGDLTNRLTHPRYGVQKTYLARVEGELGPTQMHKLQGGVHLAEGRTHGAKVRVRRREGRHGTLEITISEGMNRQVRRMLARVGLKCRNLKRISIGPIKIGELDSGESRRLSADEIERLRQAIAGAESESKGATSEREEPQDTQEREARETTLRGSGKPKKRYQAPAVVADEEEIEETEDMLSDAQGTEDADDSVESEIDKWDAEEAEEETTPAAAKSATSAGEDSDEDEGDEEHEEHEEHEESKTPIAVVESEESNEPKETDESSEEDETESARPWEKREIPANAGGKQWVDRGAPADPDVVAAAAEQAREDKAREREVYLKEREEQTGGAEAEDSPKREERAPARAERPSGRPERPGRVDRHPPAAANGRGGFKGGSSAGRSDDRRSGPRERPSYSDRRPAGADRRPSGPRPSGPRGATGADRRPGSFDRRPSYSKFGAGSGTGPRRERSDRDQRPRSGGGSDRPAYRPRTSESSDRPAYRPRTSESSDRPAYRPRTSSSAGSWKKPGSKPWENRERSPRADGPSSGASRGGYAGRSDSRGPRPTYGDRPKRPWENDRAPAGGSDRAPRPASSGKPWEKSRESRGGSNRERSPRPYAPRGPRGDGGSSGGDRRPSRYEGPGSYGKKPGGFEKRPAGDSRGAYGKRPDRPSSGGSRGPRSAGGSGESRSTRPWEK